MKTLIATLILSGAVYAQDTTPFVTLPDFAPGPIVTAVISGQGTDIIKRTTGYRPASSSLARIDICNVDPQNDHNQSVSGAVAAIVLQEQYSVYGSEVVNAVLAQLQSRDLFTRAQKAIGAASNTAVLLTALFKTLSPTTAAIISAAPSIAQAILPAVGDARDLAALGQKILQDNTALTLGKKGSGNDCHTGLVVVMAPAVKIARVTVQ
jgi:hypothetical protein